MKKKKIIIISPSIESLGGISRVAEIYKENNVFKNHTCFYVSSTTDKKINLIIYLLLNLLKYLKLLIGQCDLVYIHTSSKNSFLRKSIFVIIALIFKKKIIIHIHPTHFISYFQNSKKYHKKYIVWILKSVDALIVLSNEMKENIQQLVPEQKVYPLPNPIVVSSMINKNNIIRAHNKLLFLGWYIREKGVYELVDSIEKINITETKVFLDFFGTKQIEQLRNYVKTKNLDHIITVNDWIDFEPKIDKLYESTALILPSYSEGLPNVILEAMSTKTPIISTNVGGLKEILVDGKNCLITKTKNFNDLSQKILYLLEDSKLRENIAKNAYFDVRTKYDIGIIKPKIQTILRDIIKI